MKLAVMALTMVLSIGTGAQRQVYDPGTGVTLPLILKIVKPAYTQQAKAKKIQGLVRLQTIVEEDGSVGEVVVLTSLDSELDQQAIVALKQWKFKPGTREGTPVPVRITCELAFTLK